MTTRLLIVDDSPAIRGVLAREIGHDPDLEVIGTAPDPYTARDLIVDQHPDLVLLDLDMPSMDGLTFLKKLMRYFPLPVIALTAPDATGRARGIEALEAGAVDVASKPWHQAGLAGLSRELIAKIKTTGHARLKPQMPAGLAEKPGSGHMVLSRLTSKIVAIGSSTGGTRALERILPLFPANGPAMVIVQHMPAHFTYTFADRLNKICAMEVKEAADNDQVRPGRILLAPGNLHMLLKKTMGGFSVQIKNGPRICHQRPSVDVLFTSAARCAGGRAIGVILTGMGNDGAEGLLKMRQAGASTIAQDEASCVIFGMPKMAIEAGGVEQILPLDLIPKRIQELAEEGGTQTAARA